MKFMRPPSTAIFLWLFFTGPGGGGYGPLVPPPGSATVRSLEVRESKPRSVKRTQQKQNVTKINVLCQRLHLAKDPYFLSENHQFGLVCFLHEHVYVQRLSNVYLSLSNV